MPIAATAATAATVEKQPILDPATTTAATTTAATTKAATTKTAATKTAAKALKAKVTHVVNGHSLNASLKVSFDNTGRPTEVKPSGVTWWQALLGTAGTFEGVFALSHFAAHGAKLVGHLVPETKVVNDELDKVEQAFAGPGAVKDFYSAIGDVKNLATKKGTAANNAISLGSHITNCAKKISKFIKWLTTIGALKLSQMTADSVKYGGKAFGVVRDAFNITAAVKALAEGNFEKELKGTLVANHLLAIAVAISSVAFAVFTILSGFFAMTAAWVTIGIPVSLTVMIVALTVKGIVSVHAKREASVLVAERLEKAI